MRVHLPRILYGWGTWKWGVTESDEMMLVHEEIRESDEETGVEPRYRQQFED